MLGEESEADAEAVDKPERASTGPITSVATPATTPPPTRLRKTRLSTVRANHSLTNLTLCSIMGRSSFARILVQDLRGGAKNRKTYTSMQVFRLYSVTFW
jgi:hypothetical protein